MKTNKHDAADAEGCCEAVQRPSRRFVPVKSEAQQSLLMLHRIRDRLIAERTGTINAIRGHMAEFGIIATRRGLGMRELLAIISDVDDARLPSMARELLVLQVKHLRALESRIADLDGRLQHQARNDEAARRLTAIPGIGPVNRDGDGGDGRRRADLPQQPQLCRVAWSHASPARDRWPRTAARDQQAG